MTPHFRPLAAVAFIGIVAFLSLPDISSKPVHAQRADPCSAVLADPAMRGQMRRLTRVPIDKPRGLDPDPRGRHLDGVWTHRATAGQRRSLTGRLDAPASDNGEIAVLQDVGDLMTLPNPLDLGDAALRFTPNAQGGYDVQPVAYDFRQPLGTPVTLTDDDTRELILPFGFTFFGQQYDRVFVNSDGNLTFRESDTASTERSVSRFLTGPPRIAPMFADLDPSAGGRVLTWSDPNALSVTWCGVPQFERTEIATIQLTVFADGPIEMHVSSSTTLGDAVIGVSPGGATDFVIADLSQPGAIAGGGAAVGERFTTSSGLDVIGVTRRFLASHPDDFDNLFVFTDQPLIRNAFAYEQTVSNTITGLGMGAFNYAAAYGSAGRLQSVCNMDGLTKYPDDPRAKFLGENTTLSLLGHEFAHRWLAFLSFRDHTGHSSHQLLGRDRAHWSFFFDSDASVSEGNDIVDHGGSFSTHAAVQKFSRLDQYAMGLIDQTEVPPMFYVENPTNIVPPKTESSSPAVGVRFEGTRRDVTIEDVIAAMGPRNPSAAESPREYRQGFLYIIGPGRTADPLAVQKLDRIRMAWDHFVSVATDFRLRVDTRLRLPDPADESSRLRSSRR